MHIAFVHCRIANGGALNVLKDIIEQQTYKTATIFTLYSERKFLEVQGQKIPIITALPKWMNNIFLYCSKHKIPLISSILDYRNLMLFYPLWMRVLSWKIKKNLCHSERSEESKQKLDSSAKPQNDEISHPEGNEGSSMQKIDASAKPQNDKKSIPTTKIIISSFAIAKNISLPKNIPNILYLHSPMQYIRSHHSEYLKKLTGYKKRLFKTITPRLRKRDKKYKKFDTVIANSEYTADLAKEIYNITCDSVAYPKVNEQYLNTLISETDTKQGYYVYTGRLVNFVKECDKIIKLFNENGLPLLMIGSGPDELYLKSLAKDNIIFLGRIQDQKEMISIIKKAKGMINITKESFGLGTAESLLCGTPVLGFSDCASKELIDETSGILIANKDHTSLKTAFEQFITTNRESQTIQENIKKKLAKH
ncbi:MAG: hypothetical protein CR971_01710, partial [candidate division SR1 bacterium]